MHYYRRVGCEEGGGVDGARDERLAAHHLVEGLPDPLVVVSAGAAAEDARARGVHVRVIGNE